MTNILCIAGPTASGKSSRAVEEALARSGEVISVDSRQVYRGLDIGTEKITREEMRGVPHHLIDIRDASDPYSAADFVADASTLIEAITARGHLPILAGGTHFYFDVLLHGLPEGADPDPSLRAELETLSTEDLFARIRAADPHRATKLDPQNRRRLVRALEIITTRGSVPPRTPRNDAHYDAEWIIIDPPREALRERIDARLTQAFERGLVEEVRRVREQVGDARQDELGLEYRIVGEYLSRSAKATQDAAQLKVELMPILSAKLWQYARRQKAWLRKLENETIAAAPSHPDRS